MEEIGVDVIYGINIIPVNMVPNELLKKELKILSYIPDFVTKEFVRNNSLTENTI